MDVVTLGETMVLFNPIKTGPLRYSSQFEKTIGGAESNVAIGLARLGHQVGWISRLGDDEFGLYIRNFIRGEGVNTDQVLFDEINPTAVFFKERNIGQESKVYYYRKGSAASHMQPSDLNEAYISKAKYLHITGITPALSESCKNTLNKAISLARKHGLIIVFDPNIRLKLWSKKEAAETLMEFAHQCDIVLPGITEGEILTGKSTPEEIAAAFLVQDTKTVVIKLGEKGAYYKDQDQSEYVPGFSIDQIIDPIGAGDGFAAGFLSGLLRGFSLQEAVRLGNRVGAFALTVVGDVEGYPYWSQIDPNNEKKETITR
jgi:2-dehydro-3-deoxygluconokinase